VQQDLLEGPRSQITPPVTTEIVRGVTGDAGLQASRSPDQDFIGACPDCGSQLAFIEGCAKCHVCGFSECG
jgi:hypothetical protein